MLIGLMGPVRSATMRSPGRATMVSLRAGGDPLVAFPTEHPSQCCSVAVGEKDKMPDAARS